jgi:Pectate lyase superfamily protein
MKQNLGVKHAPAQEPKQAAGTAVGASNQTHTTPRALVPRLASLVRPAFSAVWLALLLPQAAFAQLLPAERTADWSLSGIPGGIPNRTTICASLAAGATQAAIQSALNTCPANQVVKLAAGTFNVSGGLTIPSNVVLRGDGPKQTILNASGSSGGFIRFGAGATPRTANSVAITAGASAKSTSITLASTSGVTVGSHLMITQLNDPTYVSITTTNGSCTWCDGGIGWNGTRVQGQIVEVTSVSGTTVSISPGLYVGYARTPLATPITMAAKNAGVEDLQVYMNNTGFTANFRMEGAAYSWVKNVESNYTDGDHAQVLWAYRNEIRDSHFHDGFTHAPGQSESSIFIANKSSGTLVENNILRRLHAGVMLNWGAAGNVIAFNYFDNNFDSAGYNSLFPSISVHGAHPMFNLLEGNIAAKLDVDYYWGSSSHGTAFRNWFKGASQVIGPLTGRAAEQPATAFWASQALAAIDLSQTARYYNLVGNVIGSDWQKSVVKKWTASTAWPQSRSYYTTNNPYGYAFGYANLSDGGGDSGNSSMAYSTAIIHGDYDFVTGLTRWDPAVNAAATARTLPDSLFRASKPAWFGTLGWPAFGPSAVAKTGANVGNIPAKACFDQGKMPTCLAPTAPVAVTVQPPPTLTVQ